MTESEPIIVQATEGETQLLSLEGNAIILGGVEVHVQFFRHNGDPGIQVSWTPPFGSDDVPEWMEEINQRFAGLCKETVMNMQDRSRFRLLKLVRKDGGKDRMLYRLYVAVRIADDGSHEHFVMDYLDPAFVAIDPGVVVRAEKAKKMVEGVMGGGMNSRSEFL
jgi:hypothetical protein